LSVPENSDHWNKDFGRRGEGVEQAGKSREEEEKMVRLIKAKEKPTSILKVKALLLIGRKSREKTTEK